MVFEEMNAHEIKEKIVSKEQTAQDVCNEALERIKKVDPEIKAFISVDEQGAMQAARKVDQQLAKGEPVGLLAGVPVALKDNMCTRDFETTCASTMLKGWKPPYDATVVERLKKAGAVILGKVNMDEFAMGSSCENSAFFPTKNPWNTNHVTGGSSGGSAAAVAAGLAPLSIGSDTGGSIRQPASFCGVVGLKPTYGRVSRYGLVAFASSLDQIGPFANSVEDAALLLEVIAGYDSKDSTSADVAVGNYTKELTGDLTNLKIGLPKEYFAEGIQEDVRQAVAEAKKTLQDGGATFIDVSLPHTDYCLAAYYLVATAEASSNLARYDGVQYGLRQSTENLLSMYEQTRAKGFGDEVKRRIMLGTYALSAGYYDAYYKKALQVRTLIQQDFSEAFKQCDVILTPTSPTTAFKIGEKTSDPLTMYLSDIYTISLNLAGLPGISVPCGFTTDSLPIGLQLVGKAFDESTLFSVAKNYQNATGWHLKKPSQIVDR